MNKTKLVLTLILAFAFVFAQVGNVAAAPLAQETTPITGTIETIVPETDAEGVTTVVVTLSDGQTFRLSVETAASLGLLVLDEGGQPVLDSETGLPQVDETQVGQTVEIDPATVISEETEEDVHPISAILAAFFDQDASVIDEYHTDGFGFGMIAQALWMSQNLEGDASVAGLILEAKQTGDYSAFVLPDGSVPTNWGQFKKAVSDKKNNLGIIVSGHADDEDSTHPGNGNGHGNGNGNGGGNGNGNGNGGGNGNGHGNGNNNP